MKRHILVISQYFYPEEFRINDISKEWVKRGYEVTVLTGIPNYPEGRFYKGYGWFQGRKEEYEGVHIVRLPIIPRGKRTITLVMNYLSFVVSGFIWARLTGIEVEGVFVFEVSPMTQALPGIWYAKRKKIPCCIYVQDLWPENIEIVTGLSNRRIIGAIDRMVDYIYGNCAKILATSPSFVQRIEERAGAWNGEESKVVYWPQYAEEFYHPEGKKELKDMPRDNKLKIVFTGNIGYAQGLDILPKTAALLKKEKAECSFIIIGDGRYREEFEKEIARNGTGEMFFLLGRKSPEEIPYYLAWCDVAFISFAKNSLFEMTIPAKLQSYMACGMPILASAAGETERIIRDAGCGVACGLGDEDKLAHAILDIMEMPPEHIRAMSENALAYYRKNFSKKDLLDKLDAILFSPCGIPRSGIY